MKRRISIAVALVAALLLGASPAAAGDPTVTWTTRLMCASGAISGHAGFPDAQGRPTTGLFGWIEPCEWPDADERFGFIYYVRDPGEAAPRAYVVESRLLAYGEGPRTYFLGAVDNAIEEHVGPLIGVCLAYGPDSPVACYQPPGSAGQLPSFADLRDVKPRPGGPFSTEPNCATCV